MRSYSKSKILAYRQCPKRLWLELHRPELRDDSASAGAFQIGNQVGEMARTLYDPDGNGSFIDVEALGFENAFADSADLLDRGDGPIFEAGFRAGGALAFADVMLPLLETSDDDDHHRWHLIEVKASTRVKDHHWNDIAVQAYVARAADIDVRKASIAHINRNFVYQGDGNYAGLLTESDLTYDTFAASSEVERWISEAREIDALAEEPDIDTGAQCSDPYPCPFAEHCNRHHAAIDYPLTSLPRFSGVKRAQLEAEGITDLRDVPDGQLTPLQLRVKQHTCSGETFFDREAAAAELAGHGAPAKFLDFETAMFAVPIWKGTRPYQQIPFQYSLHSIDNNGTLTHQAFLDLSGDDPSEALAASLVAHCCDADANGDPSGPIFAYFARFEKRVIFELSERFPQYSDALRSIISRIVDLLPIASRHFYAPSQQGSWSLKAVLPAVCPDLSYDQLGDSIRNGAMAVQGYMEAVASGTSAERKAEIECELLEYCCLDTLALVRMWEVFRGGGTNGTYLSAQAPKGRNTLAHGNAMGIKEINH